MPATIEQAGGTVLSSVCSDRYRDKTEPEITADFLTIYEQAANIVRKTL